MVDIKNDRDTVSNDDLDPCKKTTPLGEFYKTNHSFAEIDRTLGRLPGQVLGYYLQRSTHSGILVDVLDIACGKNLRAARDITIRHSPKVKVIGIDTEQLDDSNFPNLTGIQGDATLLERYVKPNSMDFIYSYRFIPFFNNASDVLKVIQAAGQTLRPGGSALLHDIYFSARPKLFLSLSSDYKIYRHPYRLTFIAREPVAPELKEIIAIHPLLGQV